MAEGTCEYCGRRYERPPSLLGRFCSKKCWYASKRMTRTSVRRIRYLPQHPLAGTGGYVSEARVVLYGKIGPGIHPCHWCGISVKWVVGERGNRAGNLTADHLNDDELDDSPQNLVPACGTCNGTRPRRVEDDENYVVRANGTRLRVGDRRHCRACGMSFVTTVTLRNYCSRKCSGTKKRK